MGDESVTVLDDPSRGSRFGDRTFAPIAVADRNGVDESLFHGVGVVLAADGSVKASLGDIGADIYPRSSLKPFQSAAMVEHGLDLPDRLLALVTASHSGEPGHLAGVQEILELHDLSVDDLGNAAAFPLDADQKAAVMSRGVAASALMQNCSGKHAGMLATCRINGWTIEDYLDVDHPLQRAISDAIEALGAQVLHIGVDGCGAPSHVLELEATARALRALAVGGSPVTRAMNAEPWMAGGTGRDSTLWMQAVDGLAAKEGAQGVMVLALPDGRAAALKIADGTDGARQAATVEALRHMDVDVDGAHRATRERVAVSVMGGGRTVGTIRPLPWN